MIVLAGTPLNDPYAIMHIASGALICIYASIMAGSNVTYRLRALAGFLQAVIVVQLLFNKYTHTDPLSGAIELTIFTALYTLVFTLVTQAVSNSVKKRKSALNARCAKCGYLLYGLYGKRCPECGKPFAEKFDAPRAEPHDIF
jgi:ribosomal protein L37E